MEADETNGQTADREAPAAVPGGGGPLLDHEEGQALEEHDRAHPGPGGEPDCPRCGGTIIRCVEQHRGPRTDDSPFRVRLVCRSPECGAWTVYNW